MFNKPDVEFNNLERYLIGIEDLFEDSIEKLGSSYD
jgi:hypothetical protein